MTDSSILSSPTPVPDDQHAARLAARPKPPGQFLTGINIVFAGEQEEFGGIPELLETLGCKIYHVKTIADPHMIDADDYPVPNFVISSLRGLGDDIKKTVNWLKILQARFSNCPVLGIGTGEYLRADGELNEKIQSLPSLSRIKGDALALNIIEIIARGRGNEAERYLAARRTPHAL